jgi:hypothetical protein
MNGMNDTPEPPFQQHMDDDVTPFDDVHDSVPEDPGEPAAEPIDVYLTSDGGVSFDKPGPDADELRYEIGSMHGALRETEKFADAQGEYEDGIGVSTCDNPLEAWLAGTNAREDTVIDEVARDGILEKIGQHAYTDEYVGQGIGDDLSEPYEPSDATQAFSETQEVVSEGAAYDTADNIRTEPDLPFDQMIDVPTEPEGSPEGC